MSIKSHIVHSQHKCQRGWTCGTKKALRFPAITNPASLSSPQCLCLCLSHSLSLSHKPPPSYAPPSLPIFSLWLESFLFGIFLVSFSFSLYGPFFSHACSLCSLTSTKKEPEGFQSCDKSVCRCWTRTAELCLLWLNRSKKILDSNQSSLKNSPVTAVIILEIWIYILYMLHIWICLVCRGREDCYQVHGLSPTFQYFLAMSPATFYWD